jgi:hypothetical protein
MVTLENEAFHVSTSPVPLPRLAEIQATSEIHATLTQPVSQAAVSGTLLMKTVMSSRQAPLELLLKPDPMTPVSIDGIDWKPVSGWNLDLALLTNGPLKITGQPGTVAVGLQITGTPQKPRLSGSFTLAGLALSSTCAAMNLDTATITLPQGEGAEAQIEAAASGSVGSLRVTARVSGPASGRTLKLESQPPAPEPEILANLRGEPMPPPPAPSPTPVATPAAPPAAPPLSTPSTPSPSPAPSVAPTQ